MVGETGFEPAALCSQSRCATRLRHSPTQLALGEAPAKRKADPQGSNSGAGTAQPAKYWGQPARPTVPPLHVTLCLLRHFPHGRAGMRTQLGARFGLRARSKRVRPLAGKQGNKQCV